MTQPAATSIKPRTKEDVEIEWIVTTGKASVNSARIAFLALVIALVAAAFTFLQIRQNNAALKNSAIAASLTIASDIDNIFIEHPDYRKYFYDNVSADKGKPEEFARCQAIAEKIIDSFDMLTFAIDSLEDAYGSKVFPGTVGWKRYMSKIIKNSPTIRERITEDIRIYQDNARLLEVFRESGIPIDKLLEKDLRKR